MPKRLKQEYVVVDKGSKVVKSAARNVDKSFEKMERSAKKSSDKISKSFKGSFISIGSGLKKVAVGIAAVAAAATAASVVVKKVFDFADNIAKVSDSMGIATAELQKYRFAAKIAGVEQAQLEMGMRFLIKAVSDSRAGVGTLITALKGNTGLIKQLQDANSVGDQFAIALKAINESADPAGLAMNLFGSRAGLAMVNLARSYKESIALAEKYGLVIDEKLLRGAEEANDAMALLASILRTKLYSIILELAPKIKEVADKISEWIAKNKDLINQKINEYLHNIGIALKIIRDLLIPIAATIGTIVAVRLGTWIVTATAALIGFAKILKEIVGLFSILVGVGGIRAGIRMFTKFGTNAEVASVGAAKLLSKLIGIGKWLGKIAAIAINPITITLFISYEILKAKPLNNIDEDAAIKAFNEKYGAPTGKHFAGDPYERHPIKINVGGPNSEASKKLAEQIRRARAMKEQAIKASNYLKYRNTITSAQYGAALHPETRSAEAIRRSELPQFGNREELMNRIGGAGVDQSLAKSLKKSAEYTKEFLDKQAKAAEKFKETWGGVISNFTYSFQDAFVQVINGTKSVAEGFKDLALSVIYDIERMIAKMLIFQTLGLNSSGGFSGGGLFGFIGKLFSGGGGVTDALPAAGTMPIFAGPVTGANGGIFPGGFRAFANGGIANQPTLGLIGEGNMNEAVVPLPDGRSIPIKGGMGNNITNNINVTVESKQGDNPEKARKLATDISNSIDKKIRETLSTELRPGGILNRQHYARAY